MNPYAMSYYHAIWSRSAHDIDSCYLLRHGPLKADDAAHVGKVRDFKVTKDHLSVIVHENMMMLAVEEAHRLFSEYLENET